MGRKKIHENDAERLASYRARSARLDVTIKNETDVTLTTIANQLDVSKNELVKNLINFALLNRNWSVAGLMGAK